MDPYLEFVILLAVICMLCVAARRIVHCSQQTPTSNPVTQASEENRALAYQLTLNRLPVADRRNLAVFALALANIGPYRYGTQGLLDVVPNTYPLTNAVLRTGVARMDSVFSYFWLIGKASNETVAKPPTDNEYAKMVEVLSTDVAFLVVCVRHADKLRAALRFLESPECDIEKFLPESQALTMHNVEVLEGINHEIFRSHP